MTSAEPSADGPKDVIVDGAGPFEEKKRPVGGAEFVPASGILSLPLDNQSITAKSIPLGATHRDSDRQLSTFKGISRQNASTNDKSGNKGEISKSPAVRNSLESISSRFSISSANDEAQLHSTPIKEQSVAAAAVLSGKATKTKHSHKLPVESSSARNRVSIATRYVSPPSVEKIKTKPQDDGRVHSPAGNHQEPAVQTVAMINLGKQNAPGADQLTSPGDLVSQGAGEIGAQSAGGGIHGHRKQQNGSIYAQSNTNLEMGAVPGKGAASGGGSGGGGCGGKAVKATTEIPAIGSSDKPPFKFAGIVACLFGSLCMCLGIFFIKLLPNTTLQDRAKVLFIRGAFMALFCLAAIKIQHSSIWMRRDEILINFLRATLGTAGIFSAYCSLKYISLGDSTALIFTSPIWTSLLGYFILGEPLQWIHLIALPGCIFGIVLVAHPTLIVDASSLVSLIHRKSFVSPNHTALLASFGANATELVDQLDGAYLITTPSGLEPESFKPEQWDDRWIGVVMSLFTSFIMSSVYIVLKFRRDTPIQTTTFWFGVCMFFVGFIIMCSLGGAPMPDTAREWIILCVVGVLSWMGQSLMQWALYYEKAGILSILRTSDVAITFMLSAAFLDDEIYWTSIVGSAIIGLVVVSIILNNWVASCFSSHAKSADPKPPLSTSDRMELPSQKMTSLPVMADGNKMSGGQMPLDSKNSAHEHHQLGLVKRAGARAAALEVKA